jgi:hypothetical protein
LHSNSSWMAKRWLALLGILIAALLVVFAGAAGTAPAASTAPQVTLTKTSFPAAGVPVAYSEVVVGQSTYISYTITVDYAGGNGTLTHAELSDPVSCNSAGCTDLQYAGATVVFVSDTCGSPVYRGTTAFPRQGVTCQLGSLSPGTKFDVQIIFKVPTLADAGGATSFANVAALSAKEGSNDNQPISTHTDTFASNGNVPVVSPLTTDAKDALNSYAPPGVPTTLQTDPTHGGNNIQKSQVTLIGPPGGALVALQECGVVLGLGSACPTGTPSPCPQATPCTTQTSLVFVMGSGSQFFKDNHMTLVFTLFASELSKTFNVKKLVWYHDGDPVGLCSDTITDRTGDCLLTLPVQDKATGDVTITVTGPSQGGWGGIG